MSVNAHVACMQREINLEARLQWAEAQAERMSGQVVGLEAEVARLRQENDHLNRLCARIEYVLPTLRRAACFSCHTMWDVAVDNGLTPATTRPTEGTDAD